MRYKSVFFVSLLYHSLSLSATDYSWNVNANGDWSTTTNWNPNSGFPSSSSDTATFDVSVITLPITVTVDTSGEAANSLTFSSLIHPITINNSSASILSLGGTYSTQNISINSGNNLVTISAPLLLSSSIGITNNQGATHNLTLSGGISDGGNNYGITQFGDGTVVLQGTNSYTGPTTIGNGLVTTLQAGIANTFAPGSDFTVNTDAILDLNNFANTINSLSGSGAVSTGGSSGILTVTNGGTFSGGITGSGGLNLTGGTLSLTTASSLNTYTGPTTIANVSTLQAGATNAFAPSSAFSVEGTLNLNNYANTIGSLFGSGAVSTGGSSGILTVKDGGTFSGGITGSGGLNLTGGTLSLTTASSANTYTGPTTIANVSTLQAGATNALSSGSIVTLALGGQLNLSTYSNTIAGLNGDATAFINIGSGSDAYRFAWRRNV